MTCSEIAVSNCTNARKNLEVCNKNKVIYLLIERILLRFIYHTFHFSSRSTKKFNCINL